MLEILSAKTTDLMCSWDVYRVCVNSSVICSQTKTNDLRMYVWGTCSIAFSSCLCFMNVNQCFCCHRPRNQKLQTKPESMFAYPHISGYKYLFMLIYARVRPHTVRQCECMVAWWPWLSVRAPGEEKVGMSSEREAVMGDWSGEDRGSRFHWDFFYGGLASNIAAAEGHPARCLRFSMYDDETSG